MPKQDVILPSQLEQIDIPALPNKAQSWMDIRLPDRMFRLPREAYQTIFSHRSLIDIENYKLGRIECVDIDNQRDVMGYGAVVMYFTTSDPEHVPLPYVSHNETVERYQNRGLGRARILGMHAASSLLFKKPLHSDMTLVGYEERIWEHLVADGLAEQYARHYIKRYRFKHLAGEQ